MKLKDGWFEEQEDGTRDYIAILENDEVWRLQNAYLTSVRYDGLELSNDIAEVILTVEYTNDRSKIIHTND
jgi:hypothetical protein